MSLPVTTKTNAQNIFRAYADRIKSVKPFTINVTESDEVLTADKTPTEVAAAITNGSELRVKFLDGYWIYGGVDTSAAMTGETIRYCFYYNFPYKAGTEALDGVYISRLDLIKGISNDEWLAVTESSDTLSPISGGGGGGGIDVVDLLDVSNYSALPRNCIFRCLDPSCVPSQYIYGHIYQYEEGEQGYELVDMTSAEGYRADTIDHVPDLSDFDLDNGLVMLLFDDNGTYRVFVLDFDDPTNPPIEMPSGTAVVFTTEPPSYNPDTDMEMCVCLYKQRKQGQYEHIYQWLRGEWLDATETQGLHAGTIDHVPDMSDFDMSSGLSVLIYNDAGVNRMFSINPEDPSSTMEWQEGTFDVFTDAFLPEEPVRNIIYICLSQMVLFTYGRAYVNKSGVASFLDSMAVVDNLNSRSTTDALSANQGRIIKEMLENLGLAEDNYF